MELPHSLVLQAVLALAAIIIVATPVWAVVLAIVMMSGGREWARKQIRVAGAVWVAALCVLVVYVATG